MLTDYMRIQQEPTIIGNNHESLYRCYAILRKVKELLEAGTPGRVVLELIYLMDSEKEAK